MVNPSNNLPLRKWIGLICLFCRRMLDQYQGYAFTNVGMQSNILTCKHWHFHQLGEKRPAVIFPQPPLHVKLEKAMVILVAHSPTLKNKKRSSSYSEKNYPGPSYERSECFNHIRCCCEWRLHNLEDHHLSSDCRAASGVLVRDAWVQRLNIFWPESVKIFPELYVPIRWNI